MTLTKPAHRLAACAAILALSAGPSACGGSGGDESKVKSRVNTLYDAFAAKDAGKICGSLTDQQKQRITSASNQKGRKQSCEQILGLTFRFLGDQLKDVGSAKVTAVKVDGGKASATVVYKGKKGQLGLAKQGGDWLVSDFNPQKF